MRAHRHSLPSSARLDDVTAHARFEGGLGDRRREEVVLFRLEVAPEPLGERLQGLLLRGVYGHGAAHHPERSAQLGRSWWVRVASSHVA
jgi:hypothetical protein